MQPAARRVPAARTAPVPTSARLILSFRSKKIPLHARKTSARTAALHRPRDAARRRAPPARDGRLDALGSERGRAAPDRGALSGAARAGQGAADRAVRTALPGGRDGAGARLRVDG